MSSLEAICAELRAVAEDDSMTKLQKFDILREVQSVVEDCISTVTYND